MKTEKQKDIIGHLENLVNQRFSIKELNAYLSEVFKEDIKVEDISRDDDELVDYNLLFESLNEDTAGFFDIYFLKMRKKGFDNTDMYITEVVYEFN